MTHPRLPLRAIAFGPVLATLVASSAIASPESLAAALAQKAQDTSLALEIATDLTTEIGPRLYGSESEKRAANWAVKRFSVYGFDKIWMESFSVERGWKRGLETASVTSPSPQSLVITALGGSVPTPAEGIEAEIALFKTIDAMLEQPEGSLNGKIAVVTQPMAIGGYSKISGAIRSKGPSEAARRGAIAFLMRSAGTDNDRIAHTGGTSYLPEIPHIPAAALSVPDAQQLDRLSERFDKIRIKLVLTPEELGTVTSQNVIAEITGSERPDEIVLLGAHLDSWDLGTGAIDDGAGVGIVMAAGKLIRDLPNPPKRTIRIVLFGAEEIGIIGGQYYADHHADELANHIVATEADAGQGPVEFMNIGLDNTLDPTLATIRKALQPLGIKSGRSKSSGGPDIGPMHAKGVPAIGLSMNTDDYFDLHHTANDTLDKIEPKRINQSAAAFVITAYLASELGGYYRIQP
ncbi:MAG: M20/M25/M40 family metallo-hydrolase [Opitutales bacterium]|nr:M20/M25/M40 family metallo-hydrolase [Opitutales bacterium]